MFDFKWKGKMWCIDAAKEDGSFGRLVNDDHKHPNCRMKMIEVDGRPHLCLFAIEDIKEGDEITYDYGGGDWPWRKKVREDTVSRSNIKESQPPSLSEPVLSTCSSASDQRTGKNTISENSAQENHQLLQSGPVLSACSSASDQQRTKKDTISEISAQENCLPLQSRPALSACSSANDKMRNSNPEKTAWVTPMSRQSEPLKDDSNNSSSGQSSSSGNTDDEHACVPKLRRTRSILMRGFVPEDSDELFDSTSDSGEEYVPDSRDERNESSSESSTSRKPVKWSCLSSVDEATPSNLQDGKTSVVCPFQ
ncbi:uncharacterized protein LOC108425310 [Pygocentrus nattereri]|uniref:uncharacterized protein LOC108425310 n=1 Tax=Pygocentrus nattereri TaxID=42514 RepID=UPI0018910F3A|nr:uncharacterized protein LOC108425310 [Pygocentrus nattereri]